MIITLGYKKQTKQAHGLHSTDYQQISEARFKYIFHISWEALSIHAFKPKNTRFSYTAY